MNTLGSVHVGWRRGEREERQKRHKQWNIYQSVEVQHLLRCMGRLVMQVVLLLWYHELPLLEDDELLCFRFWKLKNNLFPVGAILYGCPLLPQGTQFASFSLSYFFILMPFSHCLLSNSQCFPYWQPLLINVFMASLPSTSAQARAAF